MLELPKYPWNIPPWNSMHNSVACTERAWSFWHHNFEKDKLKKNAYIYILEAPWIIPIPLCIWHIFLTRSGQITISMSARQSTLTTTENPANFYPQNPSLDLSQQIYQSFSHKRGQKKYILAISVKFIAFWGIAKICS